MANRSLTNLQLQMAKKPPFLAQPRSKLLRTIKSNVRSVRLQRRLLKSARGGTRKRPAYLADYHINVWTLNIIKNKTLSFEAATTTWC